MLIKKSRSIFRQPEFPFLLFFFSLFLFVVPFQRTPDKGDAGAVFLYLFLAWGGVILLLLIMSREVAATPDKSEDEPG
jgi:hypothetical protein